MRRQLTTAGLVVAGAILLSAAPAHAQSADVLDQIVTQFQNQAATWESTLQSLALQTFGLLATIELAIAAIRLAFRGADFSEWLAEVVNQILYLGFFLALLENSVTWGTAIVNSFRQAGKTAAGGGMTPGAVFAAGVNMAETVTGHMSWYNPAASMALLIAGLVVLACFAMICAWMIVALVESYLVIAGSVILMAFGATRWTKDIAIAAVRYTLSVGAKLMMMQLLVSVGTSMIVRWANTFQGQNSAEVYILIGAAIVLLAVTKFLPDNLQKVVGGSSLSSGTGLLGTAATVGGATTAFALGMAGGGAMAGNAYRLASAQLDQKDDQGAAPQSRIARAAALTGYTAKNLAGAPLADVGRRLSGNPGARHGMATWRMSTDLAQRRRLIRDDLDKPKPSSGGGGGNSIS
jgi:type IV secretion system protein TrbL